MGLFPKGTGMELLPSYAAERYLLGINFSRGRAQGAAPFNLAAARRGGRRKST